jgi:ectoine hydroxylase-related dioxygenase (phytanoyl-CoA dioxygenase family)
VPDINAQRDDYPSLAWELALGDCIVFHMLTLHGAPGTTIYRSTQSILNALAG